MAFTQCSNLALQRGVFEDKVLPFFRGKIKIYFALCIALLRLDFRNANTSERRDLVTLECTELGRAVDCLIFAGVLITGDHTRKNNANSPAELFDVTNKFNNIFSSPPQLESSYAAPGWGRSGGAAQTGRESASGRIPRLSTMIALYPRPLLQKLEASATRNSACIGSFPIMVQLHRFSRLLQEWYDKMLYLGRQSIQHTP